MGCFDVVCSLTNTPIRSGQKCYLAVLRKDASWDSIVWLNSSEGRYAIKRVFHGEYNDYGSLEGEGLSKEEADFLEEWEKDERTESKSFFVSEEAWQWCQERYKDFVPYHVRERRQMQAVLNGVPDGDLPWLRVSEEQEQREIELGRVLLAFSHACKHPMSGLGQYHQYGGEEIQGVKENLQLSLKRIEAIEAWYKSLEEGDFQ